MASSICDLQIPLSMPHCVGCSTSVASFKSTGPDVCGWLHSGFAYDDLHAYMTGQLTAMNRILHSTGYLHDSFTDVTIML